MVKKIARNNKEEKKMDAGFWGACMHAYSSHSLLGYIPLQIAMHYA